MISYLLYEPKHTLRAFTATCKLKIQNFDPMGKMVQNVNFSSVGQNGDLSLKLNPTHQHEFRGILDFQNRVLNVKILKFNSNWDNSAYLEKYDFQRKLGYQFEIVIGFVTSKQVHKWSMIMISSLSWLCTQNEANFNWQFSHFVSKNVTFFKRYPI